jgi:hypothetical protein
MSPKIRNVNYVQLSDGRRVCVEALHNGRVVVTLIYGERPSGVALTDWASVESNVLPHNAWEEKITLGRGGNGLVVKTTREHYAKYAAMAEGAGIDKLKVLVPDYVQEMDGRNRTGRLRRLVELDPHLNNIPLHLWDKVSGLQLHHSGTRTTSGGVFSLLLSAVERGTLPKPKGGFSLGDCVCLLKHVAIFHVAGATPAFED